MEQMSLFNTAHWTVSDLTRRIRQVLEGDDELQGVTVQGEISNFSRPSSGHLYFTLKDSGASLKCVMWKTSAARMKLALKDGMMIEAHGKISVYDQGGQYQLYADQLVPVGEGALYQEFLRIKALLEAEGLFDLDRKRAILDLPRVIGIVTSPTGAALRDMINTLRRRLPICEVIIAPTAVQGADAPAAIVKAIRDLNRIAQPDVILLARGGGSIEDLWAFNDEQVVRAVAASDAPVITGVGHETDFTLVDFASDLRAPTPTAAAELATSISIDDLRGAMQAFDERMINVMDAFINDQRVMLNDAKARLGYFSPARQIANEQQRMDELARRMQSSLAYRIKIDAERLKGIDQRLSALSPLAVLSRGYAVVTLKDGTLLKKQDQVQGGDDLSIRIADGTINARVKSQSS
jgi:exodeoxyribonuclease VII large subunit